ncbi:MAG: D-aminoacyl-tRNA deacylase [Caldilineaceae bacterium]
MAWACSCSWGSPTTTGGPSRVHKRKIAGLRVFEDGAGKLNRALADVDGAVLAVSQFTLYGDARKGRRPSFVQRSAARRAGPLYQRFCELLPAPRVPVAQGVFQAEMQVALVNDGGHALDRHGRVRPVLTNQVSARNLVCDTP